MSRLFRSAFIPLLAIVLVVWLASNTLMSKPRHSDQSIKTYSQLQQAVKQGTHLGKDGRVRATHAGYASKATGEVYEKEQKQFLTCASKSANSSLWALMAPRCLRTSVPCSLASNQAASSCSRATLLLQHRRTNC